MSEPIIPPNDPLQPTGFQIDIFRPTEPHETNGIAHSLINGVFTNGPDLKESRRAAKASWTAFLKIWKAAYAAGEPLPFWDNDFTIIYVDDVIDPNLTALTTENGHDLRTEDGETLLWDDYIEEPI